MNKLERNRNKMMEFTFYPYEGIGPVKFLMSRDEVRKIMGLPYKDVTRMTDNGPYIRDFVVKQLFIGYNDELKCNRFELCRGYDIDIIFEGESILRRPYKELLEHYQKLDPEIYIDREGFTSLKYGFSIWCPDYYYEEDAMPETLLGFVPHYYDDCLREMGLMK